MRHDQDEEEETVGILFLLCSRLFPRGDIPGTGEKGQGVCVLLYSACDTKFGKLREIIKGKRCFWYKIAVRGIFEESLSTLLG